MSPRNPGESSPLEEIDPDDANRLRDTSLGHNTTFIETGSKPPPAFPARTLYFEDFAATCLDGLQICKGQKLKDDCDPPTGQPTFAMGAWGTTPVNSKGSVVYTVCPDDGIVAAYAITGTTADGKARNHRFLVVREITSSKYELLWLRKSTDDAPSRLGHMSWTFTFAKKNKVYLGTAVDYYLATDTQ